jgi:Tol biopolymer transport system component
MNARSLRLFVALSLLLLAGPAPTVLAQYFGQNKITREHFEWKVYESPHFLIHYYPEMEIFLEEIVSHVESAYLELSRELDHELRFKVPLIVYKTYGEFQQTNIWGDQEVPEGVAAFADSIQNRMVLPIDLPPDELYELIAHELTHIFQYSMFFEGYLGRALRSRAPTWLMEGMASYMAQDEDALDQMTIRDAVVNNIMPSINELDVLGYFTYRYGHAIFDYIEQEHGKEGLRNFLFEYRKVLLSGNLEKAFQEAFGYDVAEFDRRFNLYLRKKYFPVLLEKKSPDDYGEEIGFDEPGVWTFSPTISPSGELVAALSSPKMEFDLIVLSADDGKVIKNLTKGWTNKWRWLVTSAPYGRPKRDLAWSPVGDQIAVFARQENRWPLLIFDAIRRKLVDTVRFDDIVGNASPAFSPDGRRIAFEGNRNGVVDIFEYDLDTRQVRNVTQDDHFDTNPWYAADGKSLLYNRRLGEHWKIFSVELDDPSLKQQLTFGPSSDVQPSYSRDGATVFFSSDRDPHAIYNIWSLDLASGNLRKYTDLVGGAFAPVEMAERDGVRQLVFAAYFGRRYRLYRMALDEVEKEIEVAAQLETATEVEPFSPALSLSTDEAAKRPYKLQWDIDSPSVGVGVADDGTFLANAYVGFTDLLGNHRAFLALATVSDFASYQAGYRNLKRRFEWGATAYSFSDYYFAVTQSGSVQEASQRYSGASIFYSYPFTRHLRFEAETGASESVQDEPVYEAGLLVGFRSLSDRFATVSLELVGDTARGDYFTGVAPFQGKRFNLGMIQGFHLSGDQPGDITEYRLDYRGYRQATRRSSLAFQFGSRYNAGERELFYGFGGVNQLRGYDFREFTGSRLAWANLEFRFPLVDRLDFPILRLGQIRGFFFLDAGAAWFECEPFQLFCPVGEAGWFDPELGVIREFDPWDGENDRLQDLRASYGAGFQFLFLGGLQFNWAWAKPFSYSAVNPFSPGTLQEVDPKSRFDFYIAFDW